MNEWFERFGESDENRMKLWALQLLFLFNFLLFGSTFFDPSQHLMRRGPSSWNLRRYECAKLIDRQWYVVQPERKFSFETPHLLCSLLAPDPWPLKSGNFFLTLRNVRGGAQKVSGSCYRSWQKGKSYGGVGKASKSLAAQRFGFATARTRSKSIYLTTVYVPDNTVCTINAFWSVSQNENALYIPTYSIFFLEFWTSPSKVKCRCFPRRTILLLG